MGPVRPGLVLLLAPAAAPYLRWMELFLGKIMAFPDLGKRTPLSTGLGILLLLLESLPIPMEIGNTLAEEEEELRDQPNLLLGPLL